jgi:hypothetical protein
MSVSRVAISGTVGPRLFQLGDFVLHSGRRSKFKIDCDALSDSDIEAVAHILADILPPFRNVVGVPRGGLRLAKALRPYCTPPDRFASIQGREWLVVDDVLTTGESLRQAMEEKGDAIGAVIFARGQLPPDVYALFVMYNEWSRAVRCLTVYEEWFTSGPGRLYPRPHIPTDRRTSGGVELTDEVIEKLAEEAEQGYDLDRLKERNPDA